MGRFAPPLAAALLVAGCGGGGGSTPPPPPPPPTANQAPTFTSAASVSVPENRAGTIYQAAASDPERSPVTYSISGGPDAGRFSLTSSGELGFVTPANYDLPADADLNNVYVVEIAASDGPNRTVQTVSVTVTNLKEGVKVQRVGTGFTNPVAASALDDRSLLVAEKGGAIYAFDSATGARSLLVQIAPITGHGVVAIAAAPDFATKGRFFVMYTNNGFLFVQEYLRNPAGPTVPNFFGPTLTISAPDYAGGGWLGFDAQGNLLIATGDAGGTGDPAGTAQSNSSSLGKIILATPDPDPFAGASPHFYFFTMIAKGLHQPVGGNVFGSGLLIGDRGQAVAEEVDFLPAGASGTNFGWPFKEGFRTVQATSPAGLTDPVFDYARSGAAVQGVVGGAIAGPAIPSIAGQYIFADRSGAIFGFPVSALPNVRTLTETRTADFAPDVGAIEQPVAVVSRGGLVFIVDADGEIFRADPGDPAS
ncbi:MAG: PQQ-dependent sugar dehydrogenase [Allosphingosinicella sp.]